MVILEPLKPLFNLGYEEGTMKLLCCKGGEKKQHLNDREIIDKQPHTDSYRYLK